jgi:hypothetical protein
MNDFDDSADPELGAACNRLAAYVEPLPDGSLIDQASGLTEADLGLILRALYRVRQQVQIETLSMEEVGQRYGPHAQAARSLSDADLIAEYCASEAEAGNPRQDALAAEVERRHLDI